MLSSVKIPGRIVNFSSTGGKSSPIEGCSPSAAPLISGIGNLTPSYFQSIKCPSNDMQSRKYKGCRWRIDGFQCNLEIPRTSEFFKDYQICTSPNSTSAF